MTGTRRRPNYVEVLNALGQELTLASGGRGGHAAVARAARGILGVAGCGLHVIDRRTNAPVAEALAFDGPAPPTLQGLDGGIAQWMADHRVPLSLPDPTGASPFALPPGFPFRILALPLFHKDALRGVLTLYAATGREPWFMQKGAAAADVAEFQRAISGQMGLFIEKRSLEATSTLFKEIHHRVKNNLQVIWSLIRLEATDIKDPAVRARLETVARRIGVLGEIHQQLYSSSNFAKVDIGEHLRRLGENLRQLHAHQSVVIGVDAEPLLCDIEVAIPIGLIANELISNSLEHAFPDGRTGRVDVILRGVDGRTTLTVADNGIGGSGDGRTGLGLRLVQALGRQLGGTMETSGADGTRTTLTLPEATCAPDRPDRPDGPKGADASPAG